MCGSAWQWFRCTLAAGHRSAVCCAYAKGVLLAAWEKP